MDEVARLHHLLVESLEQRREDPFARPVTVAEIYQDLVPYRRAKEELGFHLNADFEHALLRLLAGEQGRVRIEPEAAREELAQELEMPNPNVTVYRKFAACEVWVAAPPADESRPTRSATDEYEPWTVAPVTRPAAAAVADDPLSLLDAPTPRQRAEVAPRQPKPRGSPRVAAEPAGDVARQATGACRACGRALPRGRDARYCPHCGEDQTRRDCPACREPVEPDWRFCIQCGSKLGG